MEVSNTNKKYTKIKIKEIEFKQKSTKGKKGDVLYNPLRIHVSHRIPNFTTWK
jgi:hypothetical protein